MNSTTINQNAVSINEKGYKEQFLEQFNQYLATQPGIVRGLHQFLKGFALFCVALPIIFGLVAMYYTVLWAFTGSFSSLGQATYLPEAWVNFGLSCSFMVFPWGLDVMLLRAFPTNAMFYTVYGRARKPIKFITGGAVFFAGLGIMCAGAPGAARMIVLISQVVQNL